MKIGQKTLWQKSRPWMITFVVVAIYIWAFMGVGFSPIKEQAGTITKAIFSGLLNPDWAYIYNPEGEDLIQALIETLAIAFLGTFISAILSVPFAFWAAHTSKKFQVQSMIGKFVLTVIRVFPEIVLALMFIKAVGPGAYAGVLAVSIHSIGMLGKLFSEAVENVDRRPEEAIISAGGTPLSALNLATFPTVLPEFLNYTLYRFEISVRSASILGIVGAGGIGTPLIFALQTRNWERVGIILVGIIIMVTVIDYISGAIRRRIV
ncbi:phosphonate ABC transporter, permease protein PhnE [Weissella tructae]|uniref:Phosphonate ABC transporter, permease protein n=2 Tax=Weissella TaxID=46255 RepID=A0A075TZS1_9LACO|nr:MULTISPECIES: phosphonate ABC transporter, permease protein PhnE [Weissella]AIG65820.1 Phosphonate ABC transporter, permease protein [Weissella tructae]AIM63199.1 Phosphonate ABC transporter, permease protein [Weissella ceti]AIM64534.1 Phosphonate ABC transporter, permease protein [Weissella ceti]ELA06728.1 phosphonate ABC transporter permease [Weissella ceti NC36]QVV90979.1 phosphonate ABC transporter, permease protein PhnE [Weissella tructae]